MVLHEPARVVAGADEGARRAVLQRKLSGRQDAGDLGRSPEQARGKETVNDWRARSRSGDVASVVRELLLKHYDPVYLQSMRRNFAHYAAAQVIAPQDRSVGTMTALAQQMLAEPQAIPA